MDPTEGRHPSGAQWTIRSGEQEATVVEVGGGLRTYTVGGREVLAGYDAGARASGGRGQLLMPWPNRIRDGRYSFGGRDLQLALSEPARANAIHGLVRWALWSLAEHTGSSLTVACRLRPQQGWAWSLDVSVTYALSARGLAVTPHVRNIGMTPAPFGFGAHPYLTVGEDRVDDVTLTVPAATRLEVDDRMIPVGTVAVDGTAGDFRHRRQVGRAELDLAYTDLKSDDDGRWRVSVSRADCRTELWAQADAFSYVQVFTGDSLPDHLARASGVAVEPMTCPADAFNSGDGMLVLQPEAEWSAQWGITAGSSA